MTGATQQPLLQRILISTWTHRGLLAWLLWPVSLVFGALSALRRVLYRTGVFKVEPAAAVVIVVGNVVAGGSGKTPVVMALVQHLLACGVRVGVISRGYGRRASGCQEVLENCPIEEVGDEPALIKRTTGVPVFVASRRIEAARVLLARYPHTQVIVCDDGLQHLSLHRDLQICVFDDRGIGNGFLLPAGPLREPWPRAADLVLHTGTRPAFAGFTAQRTLAPYALRADGKQIRLADLARVGTKPLLAVAAIAKPQDFFTMLRAQGLTLARTIALPDHHDFNDWLPHEYADHTLICTEKDAVKLWHRQPDALAIPLVFTPEPAFLSKLDALLSVLLAASSKPPLSSPHGHTTT